MPLWNSPIRWRLIREWRQFLLNNGLYDATTDAKLFFIFRELFEIKYGLSFKEICLILHPDKIEANGEPNNNNYGLTRQEIRNFRRNKFYTKSLILYCMTDEKTGAQLYFNIGTLTLFRIVEKRLNKVIKGIQENRDWAIEVLKVPLSRRKKLSKNTADEIRRQIMKKLAKEMERKRKKEMEEAAQEITQSYVQ